jgi:hypothetical protein
MFERERIDIGESKFRRIYRDLGLQVRPRKKRKVRGNAIRSFNSRTSDGRLISCTTD